MIKKLRAYGRVVLMAFKMTLLQNFTDAFILFGILIQPLIIAVLAFWMFKDRSSDSIIFVVIGSGMTGLWTVTLFVSGSSITQERWAGTLELLVGVPTPMQLIVFGKNLANVTQSLLSMLVSYALGGLMFGLAPRIADPVLFTPTLIIGMLSYVCFGLVLSPLFILNPDVNRWQNALEFPVYILSGFLFPIALLPGWTTPLSYVLTPYWVARALHNTSTGLGSVDDTLFSWAMMAILSLIYLIIAQILFRRLLYRARVQATLDRQ
ncbi:MAG: ABC transporter permease [Anaerolineales bacterium]|nr:ABC transporter permease [Anaerolineales bacterium]